MEHSVFAAWVSERFKSFESIYLQQASKAFSENPKLGEEFSDAGKAIETLALIKFVKEAYSQKFLFKLAEYLSGRGLSCRNRLDSMDEQSALRLAIGRSLKQLQLDLGWLSLSDVNVTLTFKIFSKPHPTIPLLEFGSDEKGKITVNAADWHKLSMILESL